MRGEGTPLNSRDIAALNRARDVLRRVEEAAWRRSLGHFDPYAPVSAWDLGRLSEAASGADDAIFRVLSTARTSCGVNVTDIQLAGPGRAQEQSVQPPEAAEPPGRRDPSGQTPDTASSVIREPAGSVPPCRPAAGRRRIL